MSVVRVSLGASELKRSTMIFALPGIRSVLVQRVTSVRHGPLVCGVVCYGRCLSAWVAFVWRRTRSSPVRCVVLGCCAFGVAGLAGVLHL